VHPLSRSYLRKAYGAAIAAAFTAAFALVPIFALVRMARSAEEPDLIFNVLVYMVYSDRIIEGSPKNSTSSVPIMPWGSDPVAKCADWIEK